MNWAIEWFDRWIARSRLKEAKRLRAVAAQAIQQAERLEAMVKADDYIRETEEFIRQTDRLIRDLRRSQ